MAKSQTRSRSDLQALHDLLARVEEHERIWQASLNYDALVYSLTSQELIWGSADSAKFLAGSIGRCLKSSGLPASGVVVIAYTSLDKKVITKDAALRLEHLGRNQWIRKKWRDNDQDVVMEGFIISEVTWQGLAKGEFLKNHTRDIVTALRRLIEQQINAHILDLAAQFSDLTVPEIHQFLTRLDDEARIQLSMQLATVGDQSEGGRTIGDELKLLLERLSVPVPHSIEEADPQTMESQADEIKLAAMTLRVFGNAQPSVEGFARYVKQVRIDSQESSTLEWKREACRVINFWKDRLSRQFIHDGTPCTLTTKPTRNGQGRFVLRTAGALQHDLRLPGLKERLPEFDIQGS